MAITKVKDVKDEQEVESEVVRAKVMVEGLPKVKQIIRYISRQYANPQEGHFSVAEVDAYVGSWIEQGYTLFNTHYLGENPEGFGVLYVLVAE